jgi:carboxymethylenebutenolidase
MKAMNFILNFILVFLFSSFVMAKSPTPKFEIIDFPNGSLKLYGVLYKPMGDGPFPAVLYNHGSAPGMFNAEVAEILGPLYVSHGWVFFMPYRRGQGLSQSAGPYIMDVVDAVEKKEGPRAAAAKLVHLLSTEQLDDEMAGLEVLKKSKFVKQAQIAIAGNSFGGIETVFGAEKFSFCAAIEASGAAQSWAPMPELQAALKESIVKSKGPMFFFQAENDYDLTPTKTLTLLLKNAGKPTDFKFYPPFGKTAADGHSFTYMGSKIWEKDVFAFLQKYCN